MKALTICQPYAEMIAVGEKVIENRTWSTSYRGRLAIHAGKSKAWLEVDDMIDRPDMAFGAVVAIATLGACVLFSRLPDHLRDRHDSNGPWCWILEDVQRLRRPVPCDGARGLWLPGPDVVLAVGEAL